MGGHVPFLNTRTPTRSLMVNPKNSPGTTTPRPADRRRVVHLPNTQQRSASSAAAARRSHARTSRTRPASRTAPRHHGGASRGSSTRAEAAAGSSEKDAASYACGAAPLAARPWPKAVQESSRRQEAGDSPSSVGIRGRWPSKNQKPKACSKIASGWMMARQGRKNWRTLDHGAGPVRGLGNSWAFCFLQIEQNTVIVIRNN